MARTNRKKSRKAPEVKDLPPKNDPKGGDTVVSNVLKATQDQPKAIVSNLRG